MSQQIKYNIVVDYNINQCSIFSKLPIISKTFPTSHNSPAPSFQNMSVASRKVINPPISTSPEITQTPLENRQEVNKMLKILPSRKVIRKRKANEKTKIMTIMIITGEVFSNPSLRTCRDFLKAGEVLRALR
jgi:hypothetical protein